MLKTILIVEDEKDIRESLQNSLTENNYLVVTAEDGAQALSLVEKKIPDLVILDLGLPKISGESVLREIKQNYPAMPVIILSAKTETSDIVTGFNLGADNYVPKPFVIEELLARIKARFNSLGEGRFKLKVADLELNNDTKEVKRGDKLISLTPKEFELLYYLMSNTGRVLSRESILNKVWLYSPEIESRVVDVYIGYLRRKIDYRQKKKLIHSIRGFGYSIKG
ncbi:MAG: response regulator transcription factor [Patescibacteria group bacterium]